MIFVCLHASIEAVDEVLDQLLHIVLLRWFSLELLSQDRRQFVLSFLDGQVGVSLFRQPIFEGLNCHVEVFVGMFERIMCRLVCL